MSSEQQREAYNRGATTLIFRCMEELVDKPPTVWAALLSALFHLHGQFEVPARSAYLLDNDLMPSVIVFANAFQTGSTEAANDGAVGSGRLAAPVRVVLHGERRRLRSGRRSC